MANYYTLYKSPAAVLDYVWDWKAFSHGNPQAGSDWLAQSETISSFQITPPAGITVNSSSETDGAVTAWISGGTVGEQYPVKCRITTSSGRIDERTINLVIIER